MTPSLIVAVIVAGAGGAAIRYGATLLLSRHSRFPWAVLLVNVVGSAAAGAVLGLAEQGGVGDEIRLILLTGLCGGLTTFSTWSVETVQLALDGKWRAAAMNVGLNLVVGIGAAAALYLILR